MCPITGIGRTASKDLVMTLTKKNTNALVSKTVIKKGESLSPINYLIAKDPSIFENPEKFDPARFKGGSFLSNLKHKPFGDGPHMCPGWYLYYVIAQLTISKIVRENHLTTTFKGEPKPKVGIVVGIADKVTIELKKAL
jgi:cytochrome P450